MDLSKKPSSSETAEDAPKTVSRVKPEDLISTLEIDDDEEGDEVEADSPEFVLSDRARRRAELLADLAMLEMSRKPIELSDCIEAPIFTEPIALEEAPYSRGDVKTPTPLDPEHVFFGQYNENGDFMGTSYRSHAMSWVIDRFNRSVAELDAYGVEFSRASYDAIYDEIETQHNVRCEQNQNAYSRLLRAIALNPARFTPELESMLPSIRTGTASTIDRIHLLLDFPEMRGIEDVKDTAIFDFIGFTKRIDDYLKSLMHLNGVDGLHVMPRNNNPNSRRYQYEGVDPKGIIVVKSVIADIDNGRERLEVVERRSHCLLPADLRLNNAVDNLVLGHDGKYYNQQLIAGSVYFRTAESIFERR